MATEKRSPIVWVIKEQVKRGLTGPEAMDYTPAMKFGELRFITDHDMPLHQGGSLMGRWTKKVEEFIDEFDPERDFIIATGQPVAMVALGYMLGYALGEDFASEDGPLNDSQIRPQFLVWRREDNCYVPVRPPI